MCLIHSAARIYSCSWERNSKTLWTANTKNLCNCPVELEYGRESTARNTFLRPVVALQILRLLIGSTNKSAGRYPDADQSLHN